MKFIPWSPIFHDLKDSTVQEVQGPSEMASVGHKTKLRKRRSKIGHSELRTARLSSPMSYYSELLYKNKGFTLIEVVIVIVILSIVSAITIKFLVDSLRIYTMTANQRVLFDEGKLALERMSRDIRDARSIARPFVGTPEDMVRFTRDNATVQDVAGETITFLLTGSNLEKDKSTPNVTVTLASNVSRFWVTRDASNEITIELTLSRTSGEQVILQTKVYPKNLADSTTYKNYFQNWQEELSS